ncbi:MAG: hypothetical protein WBQ95_00650 [Terracidiphilus sp.]
MKNVLAMKLLAFLATNASTKVPNYGDFILERWDDAVNECEHAVSLNAQSATTTGVLAAKMLDEYFADFAKTEKGPAFAACTRLDHLKARLGDKNGAWQALKLADDYKPASGLTF